MLDVTHPIGITVEAAVLGTHRVQPLAQSDTGFLERPGVHHAFGYTDTYKDKYEI